MGSLSSSILAPGPLTLFVASNYLSCRLGQVVTHMIEVQEVRTLRAEVVPKLIKDPGRTIT